VHTLPQVVPVTCESIHQILSGTRGNPLTLFFPDIFSTNSESGRGTRVDGKEFFRQARYACPHALP
jgi:hypothetical protein